MSKFSKVFNAIREIHEVGYSISDLMFLFNEDCKERDIVPESCWKALRTIQWSGFQTPGTQPYAAPRWAKKWEKRNFR